MIPTTSDFQHYLRGSVRFQPPVNQSVWWRPQGTIRFVPQQNLGQTPSGGVVLGLTDAGCILSGFVPSTNSYAFIDVPAIELQAQLNGDGTNNTKMNNEVRRVVGHEMGHGIHVNHYWPLNTPPNQLGSSSCEGVDVTGADSSMMLSGPYGGGVDVNANRSKYSATDAAQIRVHVNTD
jgi:hypothetical protein